MNQNRRAASRKQPLLLALAVSLCVALAACEAVPPGASPGQEAVTVHDEVVVRWEQVAPSPGPTLPPALPDREPADIGAAAQPAAAQIPVLFPDPVPRSLQLRGAELGQALRLIAGMGAVNVVLDGDFAVPVDLDLPELTLQAAFELLARTYGFDVSRLDDVVLVHRDDPTRIETRVYTLTAVAAATVQPQLVPIVGEAALVMNPGRNVIMVTASQSRLREVEAFLAAVDRPDRQVLIEARILEVSRERLEELGTRIAFNDIAVSGGTATLVSSLLTANQQVLGTIADADGGFDAAINALHRLAGLEVLSRPRLLALNNREAKLEILKEIPYVNATTTSEGSATGTGTQTIQSVEYKNVGLMLTLTPTVMDGGLIGLVVDQTVSEQTGEFQGVPIVDSRHITTTFLVGQGETIMIGGLLQDRALNETEGVPLLMDLPFIGQAFRSDTTRNEQTELVLLMTPWLVNPKDGRATSVAGSGPEVGGTVVADVRGR